jgi:hypothetical protein
MSCTTRHLNVCTKFRSVSSRSAVNQASGTSTSFNPSLHTQARGTTPVNPVVQPSVSAFPSYSITGDPELPPVPRSDPRPSRIPETNSLDDVLQYWESGAPEKGLLLPLKLWYRFNPAEYASEAVKLGNIRFVREEFTVRCKEDWELFEICYPGLRHQYTKLLKAVRRARQERGEAKCRRSRKRL